MCLFILLVLWPSRMQSPKGQSRLKSTTPVHSPSPSIRAVQETAKVQHCAQESPPGAEIRWLWVIDLRGKGTLATELKKSSKVI